MTSVIINKNNNLMPSGEGIASEKETAIVVDAQAATTKQQQDNGVANDIVVPLTPTTIVAGGGRGRKSKRRQSQRCNNSYGMEGKRKVRRHIQFVGRQRHKRHAPATEDSATSTKVGHNERIKMARLGADGDSGGSRTHISGTSAAAPSIYCNERGGGAGQTQLQHNHHHQQQLRAVAHKPRAPRNTTSFLMSDREKRQHEEDDQQQQHADVHAVDGGALLRHRSGQIVQQSKRFGRLADVGDPLALTASITTTTMHGGGNGGLMLLDDDGTDIEEEQRDVDFEECLFTTAIERIERLSREEVNRALLLADRDNRMLKQRVALLRDSHQQLQEENRTLKSLLKANGDHQSL